MVSIGMGNVLNQVAFVFPGQGSQKQGMLAALAAQNPIIEKTFSEASHAIQVDLWHVAKSGEKLDQTAYTQPVLLAGSIAIWRLWQQTTNVMPAYVLGHSLGEYSALVAAQVLTLTDAIKLVHGRGQYMQNAVQAGQGAMAAILGLSNEQVIELSSQASANETTVQAANFNAVGQVVIAGHTAAVNAATELAKAQGGKAMALPVSVPSHCALMQPAATQLQELLDFTPFYTPQIPVIQNVNAQVVNQVEDIKQNLLQQLTASVLWTQSCETLSNLGVTTIVECGNGNVLSGLAKRQTTPLKAYPTDTPERFAQVVSELSV